MSMRDEIRKLRAERDAELRKSAFLYARTKRDMKRTLSPDRFVRRHVGVLMAAAAAAGMVIAPAPGHAKTPAPHASGGGLMGLLGRFIPGLKREEKASHAATATEAPEPPRALPKNKKPLIESLVGSLAAAALSRVNWTALLQQTMRSVIERGRPQGETEKSNGHHNGNGLNIEDISGGGVAPSGMG